MIYPNWSVADFMPSDGYIELLYNDSDNCADVVFVYEPEIIIVDTVRGDDKFVITGLNNKSVNIDMPSSVDIYISGEKSRM